MEDQKKSKKINGIALLLGILISYPIISVFDKIDIQANSLSTLNYLFLIWILTICSVAVLINSKTREKP